MVRKVKWTPRASFLLEEVARRILVESPAAAQRLVGHLLEAAESLSTLSDRGRQVPELEEAEYRELLIRDYRLVYRVRADEVQIVALVHGARHFRSWWRRFRSRRG